VFTKKINETAGIHERAKVNLSQYTALGLVEVVDV
jgi:hypothetical protein